MAGDTVFHVVCAGRKVAFSYFFVPVGCKITFVSLGWMMHLLAWLVGFWELKFWIAEEFPLRLLDTLSVLFLSENQGAFFCFFPFWSSCSPYLCSQHGKWWCLPFVTETYIKMSALMLGSTMEKSASGKGINGYHKEVPN